MKVLVTGAAGQLGRCLARALARHELVGLGHAALDVTQFDAVRDAVAFHRPALVINASAFNDVDGAHSRSDEAYAVNALGPRNLAVASAASGIPLVHVSTDYSSTAPPSARTMNSTGPIRCRYTVRASLRARTPCGRSTGAITSCAPLGFFGKAPIAFYSRCMRGSRRRGCAWRMISTALRPTRRIWPRESLA